MVKKVYPFVCDKSDRSKFDHPKNLFERVWNMNSNTYSVCFGLNFFCKTKLGTVRNNEGTFERQFFYIYVKFKFGWPYDLNWVGFGWSEMNWVEVSLVELSGVELRWVELSLSWIELN